MAIDVRRGGARPPQLRLDPQVDFTGGLNAIEDRFQLAPNESPDCLNVDIHRRGVLGALMTRSALALCLRNCLNIAIR